MESDLIKRSELRETLEMRNMTELYPEWRTISLGMKEKILRLAGAFRKAIDSAPAIDAVPVVRCKSCMKRSTFECPMYSEIDGSDYGLGIIINDRTNDDGYCHCGARMDAKEDTDGSQTD